MPIVYDASGEPTKNLFFISDSCADIIKILSDTPYPLGGAPLPGANAAAAAPKLNIHIILENKKYNITTGIADQIILLPQII